VQPYGEQGELVINEWLAATEVRFDDDYLEVFNPTALPVPLGGLYISDDPRDDPARNQIREMSFIPPNGFVVFWATGGSGGRELDFKLSASHEWVGLFTSDLTPVDLVYVGSETADVSRGRSPDGSGSLAAFSLPTPGTFNAAPGSGAVTTELVALGSVWAFEQSDTDLGTGWRAPSFDDTSWPRGAGLLYQETGALNGPPGTLLELNPPTTHYFRHRFSFSGDPARAEVEFDVFADDGAVLYLNGTEIRRLRMPDGEVGHGTFASGGQGNADREGPFPVPPGLIRAGANFLAASVHQDDGTSGDVVFGLELRATETPAAEGDDP
jgi:hypothetical protein